MRYTDKTWQWISCLIVVVALYLSASTSGHAFVLLKGPEEARLDVTPESPTATFYWNGSAPPFELVSSFQEGKWVGWSAEDLMEQLILMAFAKWNQVPGSYIKLELKKDLSITTDQEDGLHSLVVQEEENLTTAAFALPIVKNKKIFDCDISVSNSPSTVLNIAYTLIHEVGHCLGLGHAHSNYGAIMGYARRPGHLSLGADDMAGLIYLYPHPRYVSSSSQEAISCASVQTRIRSESSLSSFFILGLFLLPLAISGLVYFSPWASLRMSGGKKL